MGFDLGKILKTIGSGALKVADAGAKINAPVLSEIDRVADAIKDVKGKRRIEVDAVEQIVTDLQNLKDAIPEIKSAPKAALESNRFKMTLVGLIVTGLGFYGFPPDIAAQAAEVIFYIVSAYVLGDTFRPSLK